MQSNCRGVVLSYSLIQVWGGASTPILKAADAEPGSAGQFMPGMDQGAVDRSCPESFVFLLVPVTSTVSFKPMTWWNENPTLEPKYEIYQ